MSAQTSPAAIAAPEQIFGVTANIVAKRSAIEKHRADIALARTAIDEARRLEGEIGACSRKRVEQKAMAFVEGTIADVSELDRQQEGLERASRQAREDGAAARLAVALLERKVAETEAVVAELMQQRKVMAVEWLGQRIEIALDAYLEALRALGPILAKVVALDLARTCIEGECKIAGLARYLLTFPRNVPIPFERQISVPGRPGVRTTPIEWMGMRKADFFKQEFAQVMAQLADAGLST
ncbi:MAG: hypothetical protein ACTHJG_02095 [Rhodanobacteraceae bacterium]